MIAFVTLFIDCYVFLKGGMMSKSQQTKSTIFSAYKELVVGPGSAPATVQEITARCGISRKTFYYHFPDQLSLVEWGYRQGIAQQLREECSKETLVMPIKQMNDPFPDLPYYARRPQGVRSIDASVFFGTFTHHLESNRAYYQKLLAGQNAREFMRYIFTLYYYPFYADVKYIVNGRSIDQETIVRFTHWFLHSAITCYFEEIAYFPSAPLTTWPSQESPNFHHNSLHDAIERFFSAEEKRYRFVKLGN